MSAATPEQVFQRYVSAGLRRDASAQAEMFTVDGVLETPLSAPGGWYPRRVEGREQIRAFLTQLHARAADGPPVDVTASRFHVHLTTDPQVFIAEIDVTLAAPAPGAMALVHIYRLRGTEIASLRDYFAPSALDEPTLAETTRPLDERTDGRDLAEELLGMLAEQKDLMERTGGGSLAPAAPETRRLQREVFVRHADRLKELLEEFGWPTAARVGQPAARAAWLVAQHADTQLDVQRLAVRLLGNAVASGQAGARELAHLQDRVAVNEGRHQVYGTQVADVVDGRPVLWPCVDPDQLDERRAAVGIEPVAVVAAQYLPADSEKPEGADE